MVTVGIIANPASGKDIRRIVAQGWVVSNQEKIAIVRRLLRGLEAGGVDRALFMPESLGIGYAAVEALGSTKIQVDILPMDVQANQEDSTRAAERMAKLEVGCLVTLGGDGTNRAVFKGAIIPYIGALTNICPGVCHSKKGRMKEVFYADTV
jgi:predicted polyphosphate/ATP-dependent NAD kinase